jgi:hypothetical protein
MIRRCYVTAMNAKGKRYVIKHVVDAQGAGWRILDKQSGAWVMLPADEPGKRYDFDWQRNPEPYLTTPWRYIASLRADELNAQ